MLEEKENIIAESTPIMETAQTIDNAVASPDFSDTHAKDTAPNVESLERNDDSDFSLTEEEQLRIVDNGNDKKSESIDVPTEPSEFIEPPNVSMNAEEETTKINERDPYLIQKDDNSQNQAVSSQIDEDTARVNYSYGSKPNLQDVLEPSSIGNDPKTRPNEGLVDEAEDYDDDDDINGNR